MQSHLSTYRINAEGEAEHVSVDYYVADSVDKELAALRSLLSDAMKALEPMAKQMEAEHFGRGGPVVPKGWEDRFLAAADVWGRIKATQTGGE